MEIINIVLLALISYILGSIPSGVWISKIFFGFDIREKGSGSSGSTNTFRILGKKWGIVVQLIDIIKALIPVAVLTHVFVEDAIVLGFDSATSFILLQMLAGVCAILGHVFPVFANFKGGKGVNCILGMYLGILPLDAASGVSAFILIVFLSGYVSIGSLVAVIIVPTSLILRVKLFGASADGFPLLLTYSLLMALLIFATHKKNIVRLKNGTESRFENIMIFKKK